MSWFCINPYSEPYTINNIEIAPLEDVKNKIAELMYKYGLKKISNSIDKITELSLRIGFFYMGNTPTYLNLSKKLTNEIVKLTNDRDEQIDLYQYSEELIEDGITYSYLSSGHYWKYKNRYT
jgi:hypothetical protein